MLRLLLCLLLAIISVAGIPINQAKHIGDKIFQNECGNKIENLVWWNEREPFPSFGIGHFIWYPAEKTGPFQETFPALLAFLEEQGTPLPTWLDRHTGCPWKTRDLFLASADKRVQLQQLLFDTIPLQATFIARRLEQAIPKILSCTSPEKKQKISHHLEQLQRSPEGLFALIDYLNFKGDGTLPSERYQGKGWGLQQVLEEMPESPQNTLAAFAASAKALLQQRVKLAPTKQHEERWLPGWLARIERYTQTH